MSEWPVEKQTDHHSADMTILITDDHEVVRRGLRDLLSWDYPKGCITEAKDTAPPPLRS